MTVWVALACAGALACSGHRSLTRDFGKANGSWWARQRVNKDQISEPVTGLDSQEAAIVAQTYRRSLAPKDARTDAKPQVLILEEDERGRARPKALAPSVPKEGRP